MKLKEKIVYFWNAKLNPFYQQSNFYRLVRKITSEQLSMPLRKVNYETNLVDVSNEDFETIISRTYKELNKEPTKQIVKDTFDYYENMHRGYYFGPFAEACEIMYCKNFNIPISNELQKNLHARQK